MESDLKEAISHSLLTILLDYDNFGINFKLQSMDNVHFWIYTFGESLNPLIHQQWVK